MKRKLFLFLSIFTVLLKISAEGQVKERRIYILDGTLSMVGGAAGSEDIWDEVKKILVDNISSIDENKSEIYLVIFADKIYDKISGKSNTLNYLETFSPPYNKFTNLASGWNEINKLVDPTKFNFITFLTDGADTFNDKSTLITSIKNADFFLGRNNAYACFVRMTSSAIDPAYNDVLNEAKFISVVDGIKFPALIRPSVSKLTVNLREPISFNQKLFFEKFNDLDFPENFSLDIDFVKDQNDLKVLTPKVNLVKSDGIIPISLEYLKNVSPVSTTEVFNSRIKLKSQIENLIVIGDEVDIEFINKPEKLAQISINPDFGKLNNYPKFLFWSNNTDTVFQKISIEWSEDAKLSKSSLILNLKLNEIQDSEYGLLVNDSLISSKEIEFLSSDTSKDISFFIKEGTKSGIKSGEITVVKKDLDRTNIDEPLSFEIKLNNDFNPLAVIVSIFGLGLLAFLILWFVLLRNLFFKKFSKSTILITEPYFKNFRIGGSRKVIFSSYPIKQGTLAKIFKGKIHNEVNPIWEKPLILVPGKNRTDIIKVVSKQDYSFDPYSIFLKRYGEYKIKNSTNNIIKIKVS